MKDLKQRNIVRTIFLFATLLLSLAAVASAQDDRTCSMAGRAGDYGFVYTGTMFIPTGAAPYAAVGRAAFDAKGNFSATATVSVGGKLSHRTVQGTYTLDSDCTGTLTTSSYDESGNLVSIMTTDTVSVDNMSETRGIVTTFVQQPSGASVPVVIVLNAKKLFPRGNAIPHGQGPMKGQ